MTEKQRTIIYANDFLEYFKANEGMTIADSILYEDENCGTFDNWDDAEKGLTLSEFKAWVNSTFDFLPTDENAREKLNNIAYNEL